MNNIPFPKLTSEVILASLKTSHLTGKPQVWYSLADVFQVLKQAHALLNEQFDAAQQGLAQNMGPCAGQCHRCIKEFDLKSPGSNLPLSLGKMILCPQCGSKRCPKASDHRLQCTASNEPGQSGSV